MWSLTVVHSYSQFIGLPPRPPRQKKHDGGDRGLRPPDQIQNQKETERSLRLAGAVFGPQHGVHLRQYANSESLWSGILYSLEATQGGTPSLEFITNDRTTVRATLLPNSNISISAVGAPVAVQGKLTKIEGNVVTLEQCSAEVQETVGSNTPQKKG